MPRIRSHRRSARHQVYSRRTVLRSAAAGSMWLACTALAGCSTHSTARNPAGSGAPGSSTAQGTPQAGGILNFPQANNPPSLDPQRSTAVQTQTPAGAVMSSLFRFKIGLDPQVAVNHDLENDLAISAESPDAMTWTINLRPNTSFHDIPPVSGHAVESEDVRATFARALDPKNPVRGSLGMIDPSQIQTPAKDTVVFKLNYPYAPFPNTLAEKTFSLIFPREALTGAYDPAKQPIGSGPFIFDSYTPDVALTFKRNPRYHETGMPHVDGVRLVIIPAPAQNIAQFAAGNVDAVAPQPTDLDTVKQGNPRAQVITIPHRSPDAFFYQLGDPSSPFQDIRVRQAASMAIDRNGLTPVLCDSQCPLTFSVPPAMGKWALTSNQLDSSVQQYYTFNLPEAKKLLEEAGGTGLDVRVVYPTNYDGGQARAVLGGAIYNMLKALPWKISLLPIDYAKDYLGAGKGVFYGNYPNNYIVAAGGTPLGETDEFLFSIFDSKSTSSVTRLKDSTLDGLIDKARTIVTQEERRKAYLEVQKYIAEKVYSLSGLPVANMYVVIQPWVKNFMYAFSGSEGDTWARLWLSR